MAPIAFTFTLWLVLLGKANPLWADPPWRDLHNQDRIEIGHTTNEILFLLSELKSIAYLEEIPACEFPCGKSLLIRQLNPNGPQAVALYFEVARNYLNKEYELRRLLKNFKA